MLTAAPGLAHLFELPNKIGLPRDAYFIVQGIYAGWAWFGVVIIAAIAANLALAWRLWRHNRRSALFAIASAGLIAAQPVDLLHLDLSGQSGDPELDHDPGGLGAAEDRMGILPRRQRADQHGGVPGDRRRRHKA